MEVRIQPVELEPTRVGVGRAEMAEEAWGTNAPPKPRDLERAREVPPEPVDLESLSERYDFLKVLPTRRVEKVGDVDALPRDVSAYLVGGWNFGLLGEVCKLGRPILTAWDSFGYSWWGRFIREFVDGTDVACFVPFGHEDVERIVRVLRAYTFLRNMRAIYVGDIPSHSVRDADYDFDDIQRRFGIRFHQLSVGDFEEAVSEVDWGEAEAVARRWAEEAEVLDGREERLPEYARIYLGLKGLIERNDANAITMDCAYLRTADLVPCYSFSKLIDEGIPSGCEGDTSALISMAILMGISGGPALMGNLFSNTTHRDIEENVIVINHDVVPPSMAGEGRKLRLRDFHATGKGLTGFVELREGAEVTVVGMDRGAGRIWYTRGKVVWTEDTVHCRTSIGVKVGDAKRIGRESFGHHQVLAYGDMADELEMLAKVLKLEALSLDGGTVW